MAVQPIAVGAAVAVSADTNPRPIAIAPIAVVPIAVVLAIVSTMVTTDVTSVMSANWVTYVSIMGQSDRTAACRIAIN